MEILNLATGQDLSDLKRFHFIQGTFLQGGVPYRGVACLVKHKDRTYMIRFQNHEFGADKTGHALKTVLDSFRFVN